MSHTSERSHYADFDMPNGVVAVRYRSGSRNTFVDFLGTMPVAVVSLCGGIFFMATGQILDGFALLAVFAFANPAALLKLASSSRKYRIPPFVAATLAIGLSFGLILGSSLFTPAHAQFLQAAETGALTLVTGITGAAAASVGPIISFIFGALRLLLVIYLAIALIQIVNSARQGEEWKDLARTPLLILLIVVLGDFISDIIF